MCVFVLCLVTAVWRAAFRLQGSDPSRVHSFRFEMIDAARNKMRVKMSYLMIAVTILGCVIMVITGKQVNAK